MPTKEQAVTVGDAIIQSERTKLEAERDATARPIPFYYRSAALAALPRAEQAYILARARRSVFGTWQASALFPSFVAFVDFGALLLGTAISTTGVGLVLVGICLGLLCLQLRLFMVRSRLMELLAATSREKFDDA